jgi:Dolichyl-phosphate-mannose-protein mannosyltransferase
MKLSHLLKHPAFLCACALIATVPLIRPFVEMGLCDDSAYIRTAKYLADTGHLDYFGWPTAILGWQLLIGALFVKLFGFSFSIVRASAFCIAVATALILHPTFVRAGLRQRNATFAVLFIVTSPLFLPLSYSFMSDIAGLFAIVFCLYCCLRAVQATEDRSAFLWLLFAAFSNVVAGTARQIAWLGVLVLVPSTFWLIRHRRPPVAVFIALWAVCVAMVFGIIHWFNHQLFSVPEILIDGPVNLQALHTLAVALLHFLLGFSFLLLPVFIAFFTQFAARRSRALASILLTVSGIGVLILIGLHSSHRAAIVDWLAPFSGDFVTAKGMINMPEIGERPTVLQPGIRLVLTLISFVASASFFVFLVRRPPLKNAQPNGESPISWRQLLVLLGPFSVAYFCLLLPRGAFQAMLDRYMLALLVVAVIFCIRLYQDRISPNLPVASFACYLFFLAFGIAGTHDMFAMHRARLAAANELIAAGIPPTSFYGGFEYDGIAQIDQWGYINVNNMNVPPGVPYHYGTLATKPCQYGSAKLYIAIKPKYALSFSPISCDGPSQFPPVTYRTWLPPYSGTIYIQRVETPTTYPNQLQVEIQSK